MPKDDVKVVSVVTTFRVKMDDKIYNLITTVGNGWGSSFIVEESGLLVKDETIKAEIEKKVYLSMSEIAVANKMNVC